jgi:hypothetical protein
MIKLIRVKESTYQKLAERGYWRDTMDSIIMRLLDATTKEQDRNDSSIEEDTPAT